MDAIVIRSMLKWPDVPVVFGWLQLDRRGNWRIRDEAPGSSGEFSTIGNAAFREFIARNYSADARGRWFFQNGPQRVFVRLAYTPFVFRVDGASVWDQCGVPVRRIEGAWVDDEGSLLLQAPRGIGLLDDRDLGAVADQVAVGVLRLGSASVPVESVAAKDIERRFGFVRDPKP